MAKRISQIAAELSVPAQAILEKLRAEGAPETIIRSPESTVGPGLEATIREWFSTPEPPGA